MATKRRSAKRAKGGVTTARRARSPRRGRILVLVAIFLVSFVPGTMWFHYAKPAPSGDYLDYAALATGLLAHHQFGFPEATARRLPAYPAFLAALTSMVRSYVWISLWNIALTASMGVLIYFLVRALSGGDERAAVIAGFLVAADPTYIFFSPIYASEHLFAPLFIGSLLMLTIERVRPVIRALASGLMLGGAVLTRGEGLFYLPVALLLGLTLAGTVRRKLQLSAVLVGACLVVIVPWYVRNTVVMGSNVGLATYSGVNFYYAHNGHQYGWHPIEETPLKSLDEVAQQREGYRLGLAYLRENPRHLGSDIAKGTRALYAVKDVEIVRSALWVPEYYSSEGKAFRREYPWGALGVVEKYYVGVVLLALAAVAFLRRYARRTWLVPLGVIAMHWVFYTVVFWGKPRYRFTIEAFLCVLAGVTLAGLSRWLQARWKPRRAATTGRPS